MFATAQIRSTGYFPSYTNGPIGMTARNTTGQKYFLKIKNYKKFNQSLNSGLL
jgi:hypothetical protein